MSSHREDRPEGCAQDGDSRQAMQLLAELTDTLEGRARSATRNRKILVWAGGFVIGFVFTYLTVLSLKAFQLDAHALTELGGHEVRTQLPEGVSSLQEYLEEQAPTLVGDTLEAALGTIPGMRESLLEQAETRWTKMLEELEVHLSDISVAALRSARKEVDSIDTGQSDTEKLNTLMAVVAEDVGREINSAFDTFYPKYAQELDRMKSYLGSIQEEDAELSESEKTHRELIITLMELIRQERLPSSGQSKVGSSTLR